MLPHLDSQASVRSALVLAVWCAACAPSTTTTTSATAPSVPTSKPTTGSPPPTGARCLVQTDTNTFAGQNVWAEYTYDDQGLPSLITEFNVGGVASTTEVMGFTVVKTLPMSYVAVTTVYDAVLATDLPTQGDVTLTIDGVDTPNYTSYFFEYDEKGRLVLVGQQTNNIAGDWEWDLEVTYDDDDNVQELFYFFTTGPADTFTRITVNAYDDHPTPYSGIGDPWKFLQSNFAWNTGEPVPVLTALSANNPLDYTLSGVYGVASTSTIEYTYDVQGPPAAAHHTLYGLKTTVYDRTFTYACD
jgi:hypothetical protein